MNRLTQGLVAAGLAILLLPVCGNAKIRKNAEPEPFSDFVPNEKEKTVTFDSIFKSVYLKYKKQSKRSALRSKKECGLLTDAEEHLDEYETNPDAFTALLGMESNVTLTVKRTRVVSLAKRVRRHTSSHRARLALAISAKSNKS